MVDMDLLGECFFKGRSLLQRRKKNQISTNSLIRHSLEFISIDLGPQLLMVPNKDEVLHVPRQAGQHMGL